MPRFMVERTFFVDEAEMPEVGRRSRDPATEKFPEIKWEHSHVVLSDDGDVRTYCVYDAPDAETVQRHADGLGQHRVDRIVEIVGDVGPGDFPTS